MDALARNEVVDDAGEQDDQLHGKGFDDDEVAAKKQKYARDRGSQNQHSAGNHQPLVSFGAIAKQISSSDERHKREQAI